MVKKVEKNTAAAAPVVAAPVVKVPKKSAETKKDIKVVESQPEVEDSQTIQFKKAHHEKLVK